MVIGLCPAPYFKLRMIGAFAVGGTKARLAGDDNFVLLHHYEYCMVFFEKGFIQIAAGTCFSHFNRSARV